MTTTMPRAATQAAQDSFSPQIANPGPDAYTRWESSLARLKRLRLATLAEIAALREAWDDLEQDYAWDEDLEPDGDEFDASFPEPHTGRATGQHPHEDDEEDDADHEHDGREPDEDGEPSLAAIEDKGPLGADVGRLLEDYRLGYMGHEERHCSGGEQWSWARGGDTDCELDAGESGVANLDGLAEQVGRGMGGVAV